jgi:DNA primase large subunit|tara:strand:- start:266 stop:1276 length:1011 start_codon:yes stop_codon:yes gene_type:complete
MVDLGTDEIVKYPFLDEAGKYLSDKGFSLEQFGSDPDLKKIVENAFERIITASDGRIFKSDLASNNSALPMEIFSFLIAVILLKLSGMNTLIRRFSLAEARRAEKFLEKDLINQKDVKKSKLSLQILQELFSVTVQKNDEHFTIPIADYLKHAINFHEREWKLINRKVVSGKVHLTSHETVRLVRKELDRHIFNKINSSSSPEMIQGFEPYVQKLRTLAKKFEVKTVESTEFPPCIKHAIEVLEKGENLSHSGRFLLATFLLNKGQTIGQIAPLFKNAPDYNPKVTLYQLKQLSGISGTTKYKCPSCEKVKTQNLCFPVSACDTIINPLQFGRKRV